MIILYEDAPGRWKNDPYEDAHSSPVLDKNLASMGPGIFSSTGAGV